MTLVGSLELIMTPSLTPASESILSHLNRAPKFGYKRRKSRNQILSVMTDALKRFFSSWGLYMSKPPENLLVEFYKIIIVTIAISQIKRKRF